jgi:hypothetical protein
MLLVPLLVQTEQLTQAVAVAELALLQVAV